MFRHWKKMLATFAALALVPAVLLSQGTGRSKDSGSPSSADRTFLLTAAKDGQNEVAISRMALEHASNPAVKAFAQRMVDDHSETNQQLMTLMQSKGVTASKPSSNDQSDTQKYATLSGPDFDQAYMKHQLEDHQKSVLLFEQQSKSGSDSDVRAWAAKTLPILQGHLQEAQPLAKTVGVNLEMKPR